MEFGKLKLKKCRYGWMLFSGPYIGKCFDLYGQYSESEIAMMRQFLQPGDTVIDVGANLGDLTIPLSQIVGASGSVYAIESHPEMFHILCANLALNGITNTKAVNAFVATSEDVSVASEAWGPHAFVSARWAPSFVALDDIEIQSLKLLKIDVDGKELDVLQSARKHIGRFRPFLYFENDVRHASEGLLRYCMEDLGYSLYWHPAPIFEPDNYFGNPENHWSKPISSLMVIGLPAESGGRMDGLRSVTSATEWWGDA